MVWSRCNKRFEVIEHLELWRRSTTTPEVIEDLEVWRRRAVRHGDTEAYLDIIRHGVRLEIRRYS